MDRLFKTIEQFLGNRINTDKYIKSNDPDERRFIDKRLFGAPNIVIVDDGVERRYYPSRYSGYTGLDMDNFNNRNFGIDGGRTVSRMRKVMGEILGKNFGDDEHLFIEDKDLEKEFGKNMEDEFGRPDLGKKTRKFFVLNI